MSAPARHRAVVELSLCVSASLFGLFIVWASEGIYAPVVVDPIGPAAWPKIIGGSIALLAGLESCRMVVRLLRTGSLGQASEGAAEITAEEDALPYWRLASALGLLVLYLIGLDTAGYYASTAVFTFCFLLLLGIRSPWGLAVPTIGLTLAWGLLFQKGLGVPLPEGFLF